MGCFLFSGTIFTVITLHKEQIFEAALPLRSFTMPLEWTDPKFLICSYSQKGIKIPSHWKDMIAKNEDKQQVASSGTGHLPLRWGNGSCMGLSIRKP